MTTVYLIRHGMTDHVGQVISGRASGIHLNETGLQQAARLADCLETQGIGSVYSSPLERALETAEPIARRLKLAVRTAPELQELDFGAWTGRRLSELAGDSHWERFNFLRSCTRPPGGESMQEAQLRIVNFMMRLAGEGDGAIALISHGDVIKVAVLHVLGVPLDLFLRLEISPGSVSEVQIGEGWLRLNSLNRVLIG